MKNDVTPQYISGLKRSLNRINEGPFTYLATELRNPYVANCFIAECIKKKKEKTKLLEEILTDYFMQDKATAHVLRNGKAFKITTQEVIEVFSPKRLATQKDIRKNGEKNL